VSVNGIVTELNVDFDVKKKLKLIGEPSEILKNTAIVKNMFSSDLEVNKFLKGKIQTVSGIRGVIKKPQGTQGIFRATFEDKILMSDIVFMKTWVSVQIPRFYLAVDSIETKILRSMYEIKKELGIKNTFKEDSVYKPIDRPENRQFAPLKVPQKVLKLQPYSENK